MARVDLRTAAAICGVKPGTIRRWVHDRRILRHNDGYDVDQLLQWIDARNPEALHVRAGLVDGSGHTLAKRRTA